MSRCGAIDNSNVPHNVFIVTMLRYYVMSFVSLGFFVCIYAAQWMFTINNLKNFFFARYWLSWSLCCLYFEKK